MISKIPERPKIRIERAGAFNSPPGTNSKTASDTGLEYIESCEILSGKSAKLGL